jgi:hypothetical protein
MPVPSAPEPPVWCSKPQPAALSPLPIPHELEQARALAETLAIDFEDGRLEAACIQDMRRTQGAGQALTGSALQPVGKAWSSSCC